MFKIERGSKTKKGRKENNSPMSGVNEGNEKDTPDRRECPAFTEKHSTPLSVSVTEQEERAKRNSVKTRKRQSAQTMSLIRISLLYASAPKPKAPLMARETRRARETVPSFKPWGTTKSPSSFWA